MTGKNQQSEQVALRAATAIMIRAIILAAIVALVVSAAPVASAGTSKAKAPRFERAERATAFVWLAELSPVKATSPKAGPSKARVGGKMHLEDVSMGFTKHYDMSSPY
jgi:hypothetical protein